MNRKALERAIKADPINKDNIMAYMLLLRRAGEQFPMVRLKDTWYPITNFEPIFSKKFKRFNDRNFYESLGIITLVNDWQFYVYDAEVDRAPEYFWEAFGWPEIEDCSEHIISDDPEAEFIFGYCFDYDFETYGPYDTEKEAEQERQKLLDEGPLGHIFQLEKAMEDPKIPHFTLYYDWNDKNSLDNDYNEFFEIMLEQAFAEDYTPYEFGSEVGLVPVITEDDWKWVKDI